MRESLLGLSEVLLFGRVMDDLEINQDALEIEMGIAARVQAATLGKVDLENLHAEIDGVQLERGDSILIRRNKAEANGVYPITDVAASEYGDPEHSEPTVTLGDRQIIPEEEKVYVEKGGEQGDTIWQQTLTPPNQGFKQVDLRRRGQGQNNFLDMQFEADSKFARIYGFSYEGTFYQLPEPAIFLVHGDGKSATEGNQPGDLASRAPNEPSKSGVAAADFQIANDIQVWSYDKADFSIRMDTMTGMFEQILLDVYFGSNSPAISGAKVSGAKVSGAKVSGAKVSGAKARGSGD